MSPDPMEPPMVKMSRFRWLKERIPPEARREQTKAMAMEEMFQTDVQTIPAEMFQTVGQMRCEPQLKHIQKTPPFFSDL